MKNIILGLVLFGLPLLAAEPTKDQNELEKDSLYYAVDRDFGDKDRIIEVRAGFTYSNSNPYLNVYGGQLEAYWLTSSLFAFGVEGAMYSSTRRHSANVLENELKRHGYKLTTMERTHLIRGVVRITPFSSLSNVLSSSVVKTNIALSGRGGPARYSTNTWTPSLGLGFEVEFEFKNGLGVTTAVLWDWDKIPNSNWQTRTGFLVGPSLRF